MPHTLGTFGGLDLRGPDGEPAEALLAHSKAAALLVYLAVEVPEGGIDRGRATALLWPDREEKRARNALSITLTRIRQATESPLIEGKGESILRPARGRLEVDVWAFREAVDQGDVDRALALYRGEFLAGFRVADAPRFERWVDDQREGFRDRAHEAALTAGRAAREAGRPEDAIGAYERALELRPFRQEAAVELVRTLAERGRTAKAVQRFEAFRKRREAELDLPPSGEFETLVERIRAGEVGRRGSEPPERGKQAVSSTAEEAAPGGSGKGADEERTAAGAGAREAGVRFWRRPVGWAVAVLAVAAAALGLRQLFGPDGETTAPAADRTVAVLPFEAIGTEEPGPIAEGLHKDLLTRLSNVSGLRVISATSVEQFRDTDLALPAVADSLGVKWVLEGDVQRAGEAIQVNAQLIDPRTDAHAWARTYRRKLSAGNLFDLQGDITREIARSLEARLTAREEERVERQPTRDLEAYRLYLQGRAQLSTGTADGIRDAVGHFQQAIRRDSTYALAWAGLADARAVHPRYGEGALGDSIPGHEEAIRRALALDPDLAEGHASLGLLHYLRREGPAALRELRRAVELKPSYAQAHQRLAWLLLHLGRLEPAREHIALAVELNPRHAPARWVRIHTLIASGRAEEAEPHLRRARVLAREVTSTHVMSLLFLYHTGRWTALESFVRERFEGDLLHESLALAAVAQGDTARAEAHLAETSADPRLFRGLVYAALGQVDSAFATWQEMEIEHLTAGAAFVLRYYYPEITDPLREDARYRALIRKINRGWGLNPDGSLPDSVDVSFDPHADD